MFVPLGRCAFEHAVSGGGGAWNVSLCLPGRIGTHCGPPLTVLLRLQDSWEVLSVCKPQGSPVASDMAVVAALSFWDYAQQTDRALPGVSMHLPSRLLELTRAFRLPSVLLGQVILRTIFSQVRLQVGEAYKATGRCFSVAAGRISFCHGLKGE